MISSLRGVVLSVTQHNCDVDVGGVGYRVNITSEHSATLRVGSEVLLVTSLIVREDSMTLFGFPHSEGREIFETLLSVNGVGPRSALAVLNTLTPEEIINAVIDENDSVFKKVSGIGPKTAKLIVLQLSGKLNLNTAQSISTKEQTPHATAVIDALVGLGWNEKVAKDAVEHVDSSRFEDTATLLRATLSYLSRGSS